MNPELIPGTLAPTVADVGAPPPGPLRLRGSGRRRLDASEWSAPLPPVLWARLEDEQRERHERAVEAFRQAHERSVELSAQARQQAADDEAALRTAVAEGGKLPKQKAPALEAAAEEAARAREVAGDLLTESGRGLVGQLADSDVEAAASEAGERARAIVAVIPEVVDKLLEEMREAAAFGGEAGWCAQLVERRIAHPWHGTSTHLTFRLADAANAAELLRQHVLAELEAEQRQTTEPAHHPPRGALEPGVWDTAPADPAQ